MSKQVSVGVVGTGIYLPSATRSAAEISRATNGVWAEEAVVAKLGIQTIYIPGPEDGTQEMAYLAAKDALSRCQMDAAELDLIICIGEEWKEYPLTTSALYVQGKLSAVNAWGIDVQNRCSTAVSALKIAKDMLVADDDLCTVMIVGGYRNGDFVNYADPSMSMMYNLSAGAGAMILKKNYKKNQLLASHIIADGTLARSAGVEIGGTANPVTHANLEESKKSLRLMEANTMKARLNEVSMDNWLQCIDKALFKSNLTRKDIDYLAILHIKRSGHLGMLKELGLKEEQSIYLQDYGHIGQIDQILSLHLAVEQQRVNDGSVVCMIAAGIGYVWGASILKWGESNG